ncbi:MAG: hypothetical protein JRG96_15425 [Deltaproteobacteria bacterium]|nr:hypothetical protein [Deltaproteobacteria bacterium]MBW2419487.1 hypothetical protein [Deltaproteobacteria bacterium]
MVAGVDGERGRPDHALALARVSERHLAELEERCRAAVAPSMLGRRRRNIERAGQWIVRKGKEGVQDHWDVAAFDVGFGSVKAFGVYPALYFAGLTWTIPFMEFALLNTQVWTAGYLALRRRLLSRLGKRRYGHGLIEMDAHRDTVLRIDPADARSIHRFDWEGETFTVRIRRSWLRGWLDRRRGLPPEPNVLMQAELRQMISDPEFVWLANPLRSNAHLYEAIALRRILASSEDRPKLLQRLSPEAALDPPAAALARVIDETPLPGYARVIEQGDSLTASLREQLGSGFSATSLSLRWINWSHQRRIYGLMRELERLEYRLLAELLDGCPVAESIWQLRIVETREEIEEWIARAERFGALTRRLGSKAEAHELIPAAIARAREVGLTLRLARAARWLS